ncbi:unnamed protein product [Calypogeia fissa]
MIPNRKESSLGTIIIPNHTVLEPRDDLIDGPFCLGVVRTEFCDIQTKNERRGLPFQHLAFGYHSQALNPRLLSSANVLIDAFENTMLPNSQVEQIHTIEEGGWEEGNKQGGVPAKGQLLISDCGAVRRSPERSSSASRSAASIFRLRG